MMDGTVFLATTTFLLMSTSAYPAGEVDSNAGLPNLNSILSGKSDKSNLQIFQTKLITFSPPFPDSGRRYAVPETESIVSKAETMYGRAHELVAKIVNPKPIVDTIAEHEKYGNDGSKSRNLGTTVIAGFEGFSNFLNAAVEKPFDFIRTFGKKVTESLNTLGGKVVGLAY